MLRDLIHAGRSLLKAPSFTLVAVGTIALGIGASTAIFSVVNAVLLRPLPYPDAERLTLIWGDMLARDVVDFPFPPADFHDLRERGTLFEEVAAVSTFRQTLSGDDGEPEQIRVAGVTPNLLPMLGARAQIGRGFRAEDATPPAAPAPDRDPDGLDQLPAIGILSHDFWQRRYGGDPGVVGRTADMNGQVLEIVGVLEPGTELLFPPGVDVERTPDVWVALRVDYAAGSRINVFLRVIGKLRSGATLADAQAQLDALATDLRAQFSIKEAAGVHFRAEPMQADLVADVRPAIVALMGAVLFVLLIACANVANLLLVRSAAKERELAVRAALGGSRKRLAAQMLTESLLIAFAGALGGLWLSALGIRLLLALRPDNLPRIESIGIDLPVLAFTTAAAAAAALVFGLIPALRASRTHVAGVLQGAGRAAGLGAGGAARSLVVMAEVALCFVLLIGSGLMLRSFAALQRVDPGFDAEGVLTFSAPARGDDEERADFQRRMREQLARVPGVEAVSAATPVPLDGSVVNARWGTAAAENDPDLFQQANVHIVLPGYLETMGTPLLAGRTFTDADNHFESTAIVIDEVLARKAFGDAPAVGERLLIRVRTPEPEWLTVVGVVRQQRHTTLAAEGREAIYFTDGQLGHGVAGSWFVRAARDPLALMPQIRAEVAGIDARVAIDEVHLMTELLRQATAQTRFALVLISVFAGIAAVLATVGLYGVLSTVVRQRTPEIGVRVAFGAEPRSILRLVVGQGLRLSGAGIFAGVLAALALTRVLSSLLVGVKPTDPATFTAVALLFVTVAAGASWLPAYRAARLDPTAALRKD
jgi:putative ABC transport system permease protein